MRGEEGSRRKGREVRKGNDKWGKQTRIKGQDRRGETEPTNRGGRRAAKKSEDGESQGGARQGRKAKKGTEKGGRTNQRDKGPVRRKRKRK